MFLWIISLAVHLIRRSIAKISYKRKSALMTSQSGFSMSYVYFNLDDTIILHLEKKVQYISQEIIFLFYEFEELSPLHLQSN